MYENVIVNAAEARAAKAVVDSAINDLENSKEVLNSKINQFYNSNNAKWIEDFYNTEWKTFNEQQYPGLVGCLRAQSANLEAAAVAADALN